MPISIDQEISVENLNSVTVNGTALGLSAGILRVEIFQNGEDQGAVPVNADGTWSFNAFISDSSQTILTAVLTNPSGAKEQSDQLAVVSGTPLNNQLASALILKDSTSTATIYNSVGRALYDLTSTPPTGTNTFGHTDIVGRDGAGIAYTDLFGSRETIHNFRVSGGQHDRLNLSDTGLQDLADVLHHTTMNNGSATINFDGGGSLTLEGVTKQQIANHAKDFVFTGGHTLF